MIGLLRPVEKSESDAGCHVIAIYTSVVGCDLRLIRIIYQNSLSFFSFRIRRLRSNWKTLLWQRWKWNVNVGEVKLEGGGVFFFLLLNTTGTYVGNLYSL
jgi:hypothetical protein